jgi:hypothetical protein
VPDAGFGNTVQLDVEDKEYQRMVRKLITQFKIEVPAEHLSVKILMFNNSIIDYFVEAVTIVSEKLSNSKQFRVKFVKENLLKKRNAEE